MIIDNVPDDANLLSVVEDPVAFSRYLLGDDPWERSVDVLKSVATQRRTAVKACHASSKSWTAARAALWWVTNFPNGVVIVTAPTFTQVEHVVFPEIHAAVAKSLIKYPLPNQVEMKLGPNNYILGISTDKGVRFQGWHGKILIILDEAPGIRPDIYEAIEGIRAGGDVRVLAIGNPTIPSGPFYDAFSTQSRGWSTMTISAFDTPNLKNISLETLVQRGDEGDDKWLDKNRRPYLTTRRWVYEKYHEWGVTSPLWQSRVLGDFPDQAEGALIPLSWLERAKTPGEESGTVTVGVDVAGPGEDETVCWARAGDATIDVQGWTEPEPRGKVVAFLNQYRDRLDRVNVDSVGVGYYMAHHLKDLGFPVEFVNVGEAPTTKKKDRNNPNTATGGLGGTEDFGNLKAELYWGLRQRFYHKSVTQLDRAGGKAYQQLSGILYEHNARGQIFIEPKERALKRGAPSPDRAEACMLAYAIVNRQPAFSQFLQNRLELERQKRREREEAAVGSNS